MIKRHKSKAGILREEAPPYRAYGNGTHPKPTFIDLFCGIGGFRIAFERAGCECVFSSDWNEKARETYEANFGERPHGDIYSVPENDIPKHNVLCAGFPCQPSALRANFEKFLRDGSE
jgi:DNA (cytosine-5)-methyltransferase 1